ncbi:MAG: oxidoreductase C-terminal domain-containing protein [Alphaproteobacteria bacterium]
MHAAITVNRPRDMPVAKRLIARAATLAPEDLADETISLKALLKKSSS